MKDTLMFEHNVFATVLRELRYDIYVLIDKIHSNHIYFIAMLVKGKKNPISIKMHYIPLTTTQIQCFHTGYSHNLAILA